MGIESYLIIFVAGAFAASSNAIAGGGPILTLGILSLTGIDPRIANLTSTVALCPGQLVAGHSARKALKMTSLGNPLVLISLALFGGAVGATLLIATSSASFTLIVPWLVLAATAIYVWSWFRGSQSADVSRRGSKLLTGCFIPLTVYGGYFGGGNSFLVLALLGVTGHGAREAGEVKNALIAAINLGAVSVLMFSGLVEWRIAAALGAGGVLGSMVGVRLLVRMPIAVIRLLVVAFGLFFAWWMLSR